MKSMKITTTMKSSTAPITATALVAVLGTAPAAIAGGPVVAWGSNVDGQRTVPATLGACNMIAAGDAHSVALKQGGAVVCWGDNSFGQRTVPSTLGACLMVAAGANHTVAIKANGFVAAWGDNSYGQRTVPASLGTCSQIAGGGFHTLALRTTGAVAAWGDNSYGQSSVPPALGACTAVAAGYYHSLAIRANGTLVAWGDTSDDQGLVPTGLGAVVAAAGGGYHNAVIRTDGGVVCWGYNGQGQCTVPVLSACSGIACGMYHTVALQQSGTVVAWGLSDAAQCTVPSGLALSTQVSAGGAHSMALTSNIARPTAVNATDGTSTANVTTTWTAAAGATGYRVMRAPGAGLAVQIGTTPGATTFVDTTATPGISYTYSVKTITANGDSAPSATNTGWRNVSAPTGLVATDGTSTANVTLTWTKVTGANGYYVVRTLPGGAATVIATIANGTTSTYSDTSVPAGVVATYRLKSRTPAGASGYGASETGWRNLAAPANVAATDGTSTIKVRVSWSAVTGANGYYVIRTLPGGAATVIATIASGSTLYFDDTTIAPGVVGTYRLKTRSAAGASAYSASNTGFRAAAFTGGGEGTGSEGGGEGGTGSGKPIASASERAGDAERGSAELPASDVPAGVDALEELTLGADGDRAVDCEAVTARIVARLAWLADRPRDDLASRAEARALRALLDAPMRADEPTDDAISAAANHACAMLAGDVDRDGDADAADLAALIAAIAEGDAVSGDVNRDGFLDDSDLALVAARICG